VPPRTSRFPETAARVFDEIASPVAIRVLAHGG
jgi:hypothetical protein